MVRAMKSPLLNKSFRYHPAAESSQPGYLKRRMDYYRRELKDERERDAERAKEAERKVKPILKAKV